MNPFSQPTPASRGHAVARAVALLVLLGAALIGTPGHADPGDFQAMPGLWKIITHRFDRGHAGPAQVQWHCVDESPDPWVEFAKLPDQTQCKRSGEQRSSTALAWTLTCPGMSPATGHGRVDFDSSEHYTASVNLQGHDVVQVEGRRFAACTSAND